MSRSTLTVKDWAQIIAEYEGGDSLAQIARAWRRGSETIRAGLIARGVQTRSTGGNNGVKRGEGRREKPTSLADDGLMWVNVRGIMRAVPIPAAPKAEQQEPANPPPLPVVCDDCGARADESCKTRDGSSSTSYHKARVIRRRLCPCGNDLPRSGVGQVDNALRYCTDECRKEARRRSFQKYEAKRVRPEKRDEREDAVA
jgi:hypothetical protein